MRPTIQATMAQSERLFPSRSRARYAVVVPGLVPVADRTVATTLCLSRSKHPVEQPYQKRDHDDRNQNDDDAERGAATDVERLRALLIDPVGQGSRRVARTALVIMKMGSISCTINTVPSRPPSCMKRSKLGQGDVAKLRQPVAPSTRAASRTSSEIDCMPANRINIMNGAQRQTTTAMTESMGRSSSQLGPGLPGRSGIDDPVDHAVVRVQHLVFPGQGRRRRHDQERGNQHRANDASSGKAVIDQLGVKQAQRQRGDDGADHEDDSIHDRRHGTTGSRVRR